MSEPLSVEQCRDVLRDELKMPQPAGFGTQAWFEAPLSLTDGTTHWVLQTVGTSDRYEVHFEKDNFAISPTTDQMTDFAIKLAEERYPKRRLLCICGHTYMDGSVEMDLIDADSNIVASDMASHPTRSAALYKLIVEIGKHRKEVK